MTLYYCRPHDICLCAGHLAAGCMSADCAPVLITESGLHPEAASRASCSVCNGVFRQGPGPTDATLEPQDVPARPRQLVHVAGPPATDVVDQACSRCGHALTRGWAEGAYVGVRPTGAEYHVCDASDNVLEFMADNEALCDVAPGRLN